MLLDYQGVLRTPCVVVLSGSVTYSLCCWIIRECNVLRVLLDYLLLFFNVSSSNPPMMCEDTLFGDIGSIARCLSVHLAKLE